MYAITARQPRAASAETPAEASISGTPHCQKLANVGPEAITVMVAASASLIPIRTSLSSSISGELSAAALKLRSKKYTYQTMRQLGTEVEVNDKYVLVAH